MRRREFLTACAAGAAAAGCAREESGADPTNGESRTVNWKMVTSWPLNFPGFGTAAAFLADSIERNSGGRLRVRVFAADELVPPFEVFDAVARGTATGPSAWDGYVSLIVCDACIASAGSGRPVAVELPPVPEIYARARP